MKKTFSKNQKIIKVGNSYAITIDKEFVDQTGITTESNIKTIYDPEAKKAALIIRDKGSLTYSTNGNKLPKEFKEWVEKTLEEDAEALDILANL